MDKVKRWTRVERLLPKERAEEEVNGGEYL